MMTVLVIGRVCLEGKEILVCKVSLVYVDHQDYLVNLGWVKELRVILETEDQKEKLATLVKEVKHIIWTV
jgi:hypothetical protein